MRTQDHFQQLLQAAAVERGFDFVNDADYGNTGSWRILKAATLEEVARVRYSFQNGNQAYATFTIFSDAAPNGLELPYVKYPELPDALRRILSYVPAKQTKKRGYRPLNVVQS